MKHVSELTGAELALWVAKACGHDVRSNALAQWVWEAGFPNGIATYITGDYTPQYAPHELWQQGGPLIEKHEIDVMCDSPIDKWMAVRWNSVDYEAEAVMGYGPTPLIAAMRALVVSVYGEEVGL